MVFGLTTNYAVAFVALVVISAADMISMYIRGSIVPLVTPNDQLGRVTAVEGVFIGASNELGAFESGVAARAFGLPWAIAGGGFITVAIAGDVRRRLPVVAPASTPSTSSTPTCPGQRWCEAHDGVTSVTRAAVSPARHRGQRCGMPSAPSTTSLATTSLAETISRTNASVNERLDDLERQLPSIPSKMLGLTRAVTDRAGAAFCGAATAITRPASAVKRQGESVARSTNVAARTTVGQARSATERTVDAAGANTREVVGQARAQTARVADDAQASVEQLLDDATAAVKNDKRPARLEDLTKAELYDRAQDRDIAGRATMSKPQLIKALRGN